MSMAKRTKHSQTVTSEGRRRSRARNPLDDDTEIEVMQVDPVTGQPRRQFVQKWRQIVGANQSEPDFLEWVEREIRSDRWIEFQDQHGWFRFRSKRPASTKIKPDDVVELYNDAQLTDLLVRTTVGELLAANCENGASDFCDELQEALNVAEPGRAIGPFGGGAEGLWWFLFPGRGDAVVTDADIDAINRHRRMLGQRPMTKQEFLDVGFTAEELRDMAHRSRNPRRSNSDGSGARPKYDLGPRREDEIIEIVCLEDLDEGDDPADFAEYVTIGDYLDEQFENYVGDDFESDMVDPIRQLEVSETIRVGEIRDFHIRLIGDGGQARVTDADMDAINRHRRILGKSAMTKQELMDLGFTEEELKSMAKKIQTHQRESNRTGKKAPAKASTKSSPAKAKRSLSAARNKPKALSRRASVRDSEFDALFRASEGLGPGPTGGPKLDELFTQGKVVSRGFSSRGAVRTSKAPPSGYSALDLYGDSLVRRARPRSVPRPSEPMQRAANSDSRELMRKLMKD
jgi:arsenate reductase-like glutaredoxin family protein